MSNVFEDINKDAEVLANKYTFFELKIASTGMEDLSDYDAQVLELAISIHKQRLKNKLNGGT